MGRRERFHGLTGGQIRLDVIFEAPLNRRGHLSWGIEAPPSVDASNGGDFTGGGTDEDFGCRDEILRRQGFLAKLETRLRHNLKQNVARDTRQAAGR